MQAAQQRAELKRKREAQQQLQRPMAVKEPRTGKRDSLVVLKDMTSALDEQNMPIHEEVTDPTVAKAKDSQEESKGEQNQEKAKTCKKEKCEAEEEGKGGERPDGGLEFPGFSAVGEKDKPSEIGEREVAEYMKVLNNRLNPPLLLLLSPRRYLQYQTAENSRALVLEDYGAAGESAASAVLKGRDYRYACVLMMLRIEDAWSLLEIDFKTINIRLYLSARPKSCNKSV